MGRINDAVRTWPGAERSNHPQVSFAAVGPRAKEIVAMHHFAYSFGEHSPLATMERLGAQVLFLGTSWQNCTCFHLAEQRLPPSKYREMVASMALFCPLDADGKEIKDGTQPAPLKTEYVAPAVDSLGRQGLRKWCTFPEVDWFDDDFPIIGADIDRECTASDEQRTRMKYHRGNVGEADCRLFNLREAVAFAVDRMVALRPDVPSAACCSVADPK